MALTETTEAAEASEVVGPDPAFEALWARLARPFEPVPTIAGLLGLPQPVVAQLVGSVLATTPEADALLDEFPVTIRGLATSMETATERCVGNLRGPVLWSETNSARAATAGNPNIFICMTPSRAYDIDENRVLVHALKLVKDAGAAALEAIPGRNYDDPLLREVKRNHHDASRFIEHPTLSSVQRSRPRPRAIKKTRSSRSKKTYAPALALIERAHEPLTPADLVPYLDRRTRAQHTVLMGLVERFEAKGASLPDFRVEHGALYTGPIQYYHPRTLGNRARLSGIVVGQLLIDVPTHLSETNRARADADLAARAGGRASMVVMDDGDLDRALGKAITLARR